MLGEGYTSAAGNLSAEEVFVSNYMPSQILQLLWPLPKSMAQIPVPVPRSRTRRGDSPIGAR